MRRYPNHSRMANRPSHAFEDQAMSDKVYEDRVTEGHYCAGNPWGPQGSKPENAAQEGFDARVANVPPDRRPNYRNVEDARLWTKGWLLADSWLESN